MRKLIAIVLVAMMLFTCSALAESPLGGWTLSESIELTDDLTALFDKGMEGLMGVSYTPVAYLWPIWDPRWWPAGITASCAGPRWSIPALRASWRWCTCMRICPVR